MADWSSVTIQTRSTAPGQWPKGFVEDLTASRDASATRILEFAIGAFALIAYQPSFVPPFLSVGLIAMAFAVAVAATRKPERDTQRLSGYVSAMVAVGVYLVLLSALTPDTSLYGWPKRLARLTLVALFALSLVSGRLHFESVVRGMGFGLLVNAALFFAGIAPANYGRFLSGYLLDKNVAGLAYAAIGVLLLGVIKSRHLRWAVIVGTAALVWTTGSRTALAALVCGLLWWLLRNRLGVLGRFGLAAIMAWGVTFVTENYARAGEFSDRVGTDWFRARIDAASRVKLDLTPWYGSGLGDAYVKLEDNTLLFHNSYWSVLVEGGWVFFVVLLFGHVWLSIGPFRTGPPPSALALGAEAANVTVLVCALRLGEVFSATVAMTCLAGGLIGYLESQSDKADP